MDVLLSKTLEQVDKIMESYSVETLRGGKEKELEKTIDDILTETAKLDKSEYELRYGFDLPDGRSYITIDFPNIQVTKRYELGSFM